MEKVKKMVMNDHHTTISVGTWICSCHEIFLRYFGYGMGNSRIGSRSVEFQRKTVANSISLRVTTNIYGKKIKRTLKAHHFASIDKIKSSLLKEVNSMPKIKFQSISGIGWSIDINVYLMGAILKRITSL